jgi:hypothetical protein
VTLYEITVATTVVQEEEEEEEEEEEADLLTTSEQLCNSYDKKQRIDARLLMTSQQLSKLKLPIFIYIYGSEGAFPTSRTTPRCILLNHVSRASGVSCPCRCVGAWLLLASNLV